jgi:hypothetical protein
VTAEKFAQAVTAASFHIGSGVFAWRILRNKPWLWAMEEWSQNLHDKTIEPDFKLYYLLYAARYLSDLVSLGYEHARSVSSSCCEGGGVHNQLLGADVDVDVDYLTLIFDDRILWRTRFIMLHPWHWC